MTTATGRRPDASPGLLAARDWTARLLAPVDVAGIALFRVAFGGLLLVEIYRGLSQGWVHDFLAPAFHFTYFGFGWVRPLPALAMIGLFVGLGVLALMILLGWHYRLAMTLFWLGFTYLFLLEKALYLNHFYLICLVSFCMIWVPAARRFSLDARRRPQRASDYVPAWSLWLLRAQLAIPYFYGGVAKIGSDWLQGQPMQMRMQQMTDLQAVIPWFGSHGLALVFSYGGLLLDLLIVPLLLYRPTRAWAFAAAVAFHLCNAAMFNIGIFPWFMICATTLFFPSDWPRRLLRWPAATLTAPGVLRWPSGGRATALAIGLLLAVQLILPLRHWLYGTQVDWTEQGSRFAWRMMLNEKLAAMQLMAVDPRTGQATPLDVRPLLTPRQIEKMSHDPEMVREFAVFAGRALAAERGTPVEVHAIVFCALNGRKPQLLIDPQVDLATQPRSLAPAPFIVPLTEPLPANAYLVPPSEWERVFDLRASLGKGNHQDTKGTKGRQ